MDKVTAIRESLLIPTYGLGIPEKNPLFFEKRVYQGSCGKVYPVPFIDKVYDEKKERRYDSVRLENDYVRLVMLPEIGGRIFLGQDKVNQEYDFFYRQEEIKPALVGLAGPWISGGVEFNWPQHHRPGTFMPSDVCIEKDEDGSQTVWLSEHDPLNRLKGMHGICLHPGSSLIELKARLYNRTPFTQTFLWWANVAAEVHDQYQSFFPPDVFYVADHAVRAQSSFPVAKNPYYGVDYQNREGANDLGWYKNIPVPTSYMVCESTFGFFGGYDYRAEGGFIHVANPHISPGKKQWTWGNDEFGWAWDRELTDRIGPTGRPAPYVELMAGVYTDNQPDFTYLTPYETKTFSQYWWPYQKIGPVQNANEEAAVRMALREDGKLDLGVVVSSAKQGARIILKHEDDILLNARADLAPDRPWQNCEIEFSGENLHALELSVEGIISYKPVDVTGLERNRDLATEPPQPEQVDSMDELFLIAEHLEQYRHPTRYPESYWDEALMRDPGDSRVNIAYGRKLLDQGLLNEALYRFQTAIRRLTQRHPNPYTGEAHYYSGLVLRLLGREQEAYRAFYKATWNYEWRSAAYYELAMLDCRRSDYPEALKHCEASLDSNRQNNKAYILKVIVMRKMGLDETEVLRQLLEQDPLDHWALHVSGDLDRFLSRSRNDAQTILDVAYDYADAGFMDESVALIELHHARDVSEVAVPNPLQQSQMTHYVLAWLKQDPSLLEKARQLDPHYFFPSRIYDQLVLEWAVQQPGKDANALFALGNYYYDRKRYEDAIRVWEQCGEGATTIRNLGIAYWNVKCDGEAARRAFLDAMKLAPDDARIFSEYDQLREKLGDSAEERLHGLLTREDLVFERDDCVVSLVSLYNETGSPEKALRVLENRRFHPWEGGEGKVLKQYTTAKLLLGKRALAEGDPEAALELFKSAMRPPENLGEAYHLLQAKADVNYWIGKTLRSLGREDEAIRYFELSAGESGDFLSMEVAAYSELSCFRALSLSELGRIGDALALLDEVKKYAERQSEEKTEIDYFATSLPRLLVFEEDIAEAYCKQAKELLLSVEKTRAEIEKNL